MKLNELEGATLQALLGYIAILKSKLRTVEFTALGLLDEKELTAKLQDTITRQNQTICELSREVLALKKKLEEKIK